MIFSSLTKPLPTLFYSEADIRHHSYTTCSFVITIFTIALEVITKTRKGITNAEVSRMLCSIRPHFFLTSTWLVTSWWDFLLVFMILCYHNAISQSNPSSHVVWGMGTAAAHLLVPWVQIPPGTWTFVSCECCILPVRGHCNKLITQP